MATTEEEWKVLEPFKDLREFVALAEERGVLKHINGADPHLEVGGIAEILAGHPAHYLGLFDRMAGYPEGYRMLTGTNVSYQAFCWCMGLPDHLKGVPLVDALRRRLRSVEKIPPVVVQDGPVLENVITGADVDLNRFPVPHWHNEDGGRFIGTADIVITKDPETGWVNLATYRVQVHGPNLAGIYMDPGRHGWLNMQKYWSRRENAPVLVVCGADPILLFSASQNHPAGVSEYDYAGGLRGEAVGVVPGRITGLPMPSHAEFVMECECPPPERERHMEGPFGEWSGYYACEVRDQPVLHVKAIYHRNQPILTGSPPFKPPIGRPVGLIRSALTWEAMERGGVDGIAGVYKLEAGAGYMITVISLKTLYGGHARQAALAAMGSKAGAIAHRMTIVVDDDIDPADAQEVLWAVATRCDPDEDVDIIKSNWGTPLDPRVPPWKRDRQDYSMSHMIIDATRPYAWKKEYPLVNAISPELRSKLMEKWSGILGL